MREHPLNHLSSFEMNDQYRHPENSAPQAMLAQLDLVEINRIVLCSSGLEDVHSRDQENTSGRPGRKRLRGTSEQER